MEEISSVLSLANIREKFIPWVLILLFGYTTVSLTLIQKSVTNHITETTKKIESLEKNQKNDFKDLKNDFKDLKKDFKDLSLRFDRLYEILLQQKKDK